MRQMLLMMTTGVALLAAACTGTQPAAAIPAGHPASPTSESVAFTPPGSPFAAPLEPTESGPVDDNADSTHGMPATDRATDQGMTVYICPMHPEVRSDRPANCPKCGMALEPQRSQMHHRGHEGGKT